MRKFFSPAMDKLDLGPLRAFLEQQGVDAGCYDQMINDVTNAVCRYGQSPDRERLKHQLQELLEATGKLTKAMRPIGSIEYTQLSHVILQAIPPNAFYERSRGYFDLPTTLQMINAGAKDELKKLKKPGRRRNAKTDFVIQLGDAWVRGTGKQPGVAGNATYGEPITAFAQFVKIATGMLPDATEFKPGFADLVRRAAKVAKPPQEI
jgi:hypothetical protein